MCSFDAGHERCVQMECICNAKDKKLFTINNDSNTLEQRNGFTHTQTLILTDTIDHTSIFNGLILLLVVMID